MKTLIFLLFLCCSISVPAQFIIQPTPLHKQEFTSVTKNGYTQCYKYKLLREDSILAYQLKYDMTGLPDSLFKKGVDKNGDSINVEFTSFEFNNSGKQASQTLTPIDDDERRRVYMYNAKGMVSTEYSLHADPATLSYKYDKNGKLKEVFVTLKMPDHDSDGNWNGKTIDVPWNKYLFESDAKGRIIKKIEYDLRSEKPKTPSAIYAWKYGVSGKIMEYNYKNTTSPDFFKVIYTYTTEGLLAKSIEYKFDEDTETFVYVYAK